MKKTTSCKKAKELPSWISLLTGQKNTNQRNGIRPTGSVRISSQGLLSSWSKLSFANIALSRLVLSPWISEDVSDSDINTNIQVGIG